MQAGLAAEPALRGGDPFGTLAVPARFQTLVYRPLDTSTLARMANGAARATVVLSGSAAGSPTIDFVNRGDSDPDASVSRHGLMPAPLAGAIR